MRFLITGASGMLGHDLRGELRSRDIDTVAVGREELDVTDRDAVLYLAKNVRPDVVINCAAYTRVDDCETNEARAFLVNATAVEHLAEAANRWSSLLLQISTDFVFDGSATSPYEVNQEVAPLSVYGESKLRGERAAAQATNHLVLRTSWLFGEHGWNFVEAMRAQIDSGKSELRVVDDQRGRPTYTPHLARAILRLANAALESEEVRGIFHYADSPEASWFEFAGEIVAALDRHSALEQPVTVLPVTSDSFPRPARRPGYSVLSTSRFERVTGLAPDSWIDGLDEYLSRKLPAAAP
jgi:dTDP-4-dehydrorhamnose reductase